MLSIVDLFFFPAVCILDMLLCTASFWIFFTISYASDTIFVMKIPLWLSWIFSFDPPSLYSYIIDVSLHCNGICLSSSTLLNIFVRLSIISSPPCFSHSAFHLDLSPDLLFFILRIAFFTTNCVISFLSTLGSSSMILCLSLVLLFLPVGFLVVLFVVKFHNTFDILSIFLLCFLSLFLHHLL